MTGPFFMNWCFIIGVSNSNPQEKNLIIVEKNISILLVIILGIKRTIYKMYSAINGRPTCFLLCDTFAFQSSMYEGKTEVNKEFNIHKPIF